MTVFVCSTCGDLVRPANPHLVPLKHHVKNASGVGGHWCTGDYVEAFSCPGPASPQTSHWGPHPDCPECGSDLSGGGAAKGTP